MTTIAAARTLRPLRHLGWRTTAAGNIALVVPGAAVAVVIAAQDGRPVVAGIVGVVALAVAAVVIVPAMRIRTLLAPDGITTYWTSRIGSFHLPRTDVARSVIRTIYNGDGVSTNRHLFLLDREGRAVYRMSDRWWTDEQLLVVAHHMGATLESQNQPVHLAEVRRTARSQLTWAERHRISAVTILVVGAFGLCLAFAALAVAAL
ncbi:hypothetical protein [Amnibacterium kyonggiense]|uniref:PH (Pleckstrin Homology) domain-containing protein n=1 Tax=Amnibacterium kyonggiense TaxID=595671 RepID=A0A4R7FP72_9MICO|nr:hypothetical protein [Amnibacterium kyonggiense]TDS79531.1 hypothetical protein CLV52_0062 [Amnibacterium kyonggiense]